MISVADYSKTRQVSQTAIRRQLQRYQEELEGHIIIENRKRMLDDYAVSFLDQHRMQRNIVIKQAEDKATQELLSEIDRLKTELLQEKERVIQLHQRAELLSEYKLKSELLLEENNRTQEDLKETREKLRSADQELYETKAKLVETDQKLEEAETELNSFIKSWFGFYRKK